MNEFVLGIDPGAGGALALYDVTNGRVLKVTDMPFTEHKLTTGKITKRVDMLELKYIFEQIHEYAIAKDAVLYIHIEKVQAFGKQSAPAAFNFGYSAAIPETMCIMLGYVPKLIPPQTWKKQAGLQASAKDEARLLVRQLFPELKKQLKYKNQVDRADAILIAMYRS